MARKSESEVRRSMLEPEGSQMPRDALEHELEAFLSLSETEKRNMILDPNNPKNTTFPWLTTEHIRKLNGDSPQTYKYSYGRLHSCSERFKLMDVFKETKYGKLFFAIMRKNDLWCNIKVYDLDQGDDTTYTAHREAEVLKRATGSRLIVRPIEFFKTLAGLHVVTEHFGNTTLHNFAKSKVIFNDFELKFFATEIVCAVSYLHQKGIVHRTLTANNVGITSNGHIKLFDISGAYLTRDLDGTEMKSLDLTETIEMEVIAYKAPELVDLAPYGHSVDWWNVGIILYFMMFGDFPFQGVTIREILHNILYTQANLAPSYHSDLTIKLVQALLNKDPKQRLGGTRSEDVREHPYFQYVDWERAANLGYDPPLPTKSHVASNLPASLCRSIDSLTKQSLDPSSDVSDSVAVRRGKTLKSIKPVDFNDVELCEDWTSYMDPHTDLHRGFIYVKKQLYPPESSLFGDAKEFENCLICYPQLSKSELELVDQENTALFEGPTRERLVRVNLGNHMFMMVAENDPEAPASNI